MIRASAKCIFAVVVTVILQVAAYLYVYRSGPVVEDSRQGIAKLITPVSVNDGVESYDSLQTELTSLSLILRRLEDYSLLVAMFGESLGISISNKTSIDEGQRILRDDVSSAWQQASAKGVSENYIPLWNLYSDMKSYWLHTLSILRSLGIGKRDEIRVNYAYVVIRDAIENVMKMSEITRRKALRDISSFLRQKIEVLQNPANCSEARILFCRLTRTDCGFGCETHSLVNCFIQALMSQRTLIYASKGWKYEKRGWEYAFLPLSKCTEQDAEDEEMAENITGGDRVIRTRSRDVASWTGFSIPTQFASVLDQYHSQPFVWWIAQFVGYGMRLQPWLAEEFENVTQQIGFRHPIVGVHVRRGDKLNSQGYRHEVDEYMFHVERWFAQVRIRQRIVKPTVYLASEDPTVLPELQQKYPDYEFIGSKIATEEVTKKMRYGEGGLTGVAFDILFLSKCDYLVCTLSSSVCRTAYDMMTYENDDASTMMQTIDSGYRFKRIFQADWRVAYDHIPQNSGELQLRAGDIVKVSNRFQDSYDDGFVLGKNIKTEEEGRFPSYKARETLTHLNFPILSNVIEN